MSPGWSLALMVLWTFCRVAGAQSSITAQYGENITLDCTFSHIPGIKLHQLNITWKMQRGSGAELLVHSYYGQMDLWQGQDKAYWQRTHLYPEGFRKGNASLRLMDVHIQDEGTYFCYVNSEMKKISLTVLRESEMDSPIVAQFGEDVTLSCFFEFGLNLQPLNITWKKQEAGGPDLLIHSYYNGMDKLQGQDISYKDRTQLHPERFPQGNASLTLRRVHTQDKGFYICHVKPEQGKFSVRMQLTVEDFVSDQPLRVLYWSFIIALLAIMMFIIWKCWPSLLWKLKIFQYRSQWKQQDDKDQPELNTLTANKSETSDTFLTPPASSQQEEKQEQGRAGTDAVWEDLAMFTDGDIADLKAAFETKSPPGLTSALQEIREAVKNAKLKVAVIGETGSGKSSFVNATTGLKDQNTGAAEPAVVGGRCGAQPKPYPHPEHPNVELWELPGIGAVNCPPDIFFEQNNLRQYDLFIIITCERFTNTDAKLVKEIKKMGKPFYVVRSKVDSDMQAARRRNCSEESTLEKIREDCISHLEGGTEVFLISSWDPDRFDFPHLQQVLEKKYCHHRAHALQLALSNTVGTH